MMKFCFALAAGALLAASPASAQSPAITYPTTSGSVVLSSQAYGSPVVTTPADPSARRGLFARIRARRDVRAMPAATATYGPVLQSPVYTSSLYGAPTMTTTPGTVITSPATTTPMPMPTTTPMPMPSGVPMQMPGTMSMVMPTGMQTVVVNGVAYQVPNPLPAEGVVISAATYPTGGGVVPVSGTVVMPGVVTPATYSIPLSMPMPR